jgi:UDP-N-acetylglucosamine acyltransferase
MEGLRRRGFSPDSRTALKRAYKTLYRENRTLEDALVQLRLQAAGNAEVAVLTEFLEQQTRGIVR